LGKYFFGLGINYHTVSIDKYGSDNALYINAGLLIYLSEKLKWGFSANNLNRATWGKEKDQLPIVFQTGFSYDIINDIVLNLAIEKELTYQPSIKAGINYRIMEYVSVRTGFSTEPSIYCGGVGIHYSLFQFDYSVINHQELGFTHQFGLIISLDNL
jgi:outer membrane protein W